MYQMKKGGSKSSKQQAAIAISMKKAGKKPKMQMGGTPVAVPAKKGRSGPGITGVKKAVFNQARNDWGEKPNTQWSQDQMSKWKADVIKNPNYKKGGSFPDLTGDGKVTKADILKGRGVFKKGGSIGSSKKPKMQVGGTVKKSKVRPVPMPEVGTRKGTPSVRMPEFGTPKGTPPVPMREFPSFSSKRSKSPSDIGNAVGRAIDAIPSVGNSLKGFKKAVPREVKAARSTEKGISYKRGGSIGKSKKKK